MLLIDGPLKHLDRARADAAGERLLEHVEAGLLSTGPAGPQPGAAGA
jgi:hypothetical protein